MASRSLKVTDNGAIFTGFVLLAVSFMTTAFFVAPFLERQYVL